MLNTVASVRSLQAKLGLPLLNQIAGWIIFGVFNFHHPRVFSLDGDPVFLPSTRLAFPILSYRAEDSRGAPAHLLPLLLPVLRHPLHPRRGSFLPVILHDAVSMDPGRRGCTPQEGDEWS